MKTKYAGATKIPIKEPREEYLLAKAITNHTIKNESAI